MSRERLKARAERVNEKCNLGKLLQEYGYAVVPDRNREQQFSCDLHGPDNKPSARYYGQNNNTYCWVCQKPRSAINYVMEKEHLGFQAAIEKLEKLLNLESLPWSDESAQKEDLFKHIEEKPAPSYEQEYTRLEKILLEATRDRDLTCSSLLKFWEVLNRIDYGNAKEHWSESKSIAALEKLRQYVMGALKESSQ